MILIITCTFDKTVDYIIKKLKKPFFRFNVDDFSSYSITITQTGWAILYAGESITNEMICSIYYRKPYLPDLSSYEMMYREMIANDIVYLIKGIVSMCDCRKLTCPFVLQKAENKLYQITVAQKAGFLMPSTLFTNSSKNARNFTKKTETVIKPISTGKICGTNGYEIYNTNIVRDEEFDVELTPIFLQKYLKKDFEARVYIIGDKEFSVKIIAANQVDWRLDETKNHYERMVLPGDIKEKCLTFMKEMGIEFAAFDFIIHQGEWFFLENNPNGQWLWLEKDLNLGLSNELVNYLEE